MNGWAWLCIVIVALVMLACVYGTAYHWGYADGQFTERQSVARAFDGRRQQTMAAERAIDYLYKRARWQIAQQGPAVAEDRGVSIHE